VAAGRYQPVMSTPLGDHAVPSGRWCPRRVRVL